MTLLEILIQELPKRGGWDAKWHQCAQDGNGEVCFFTSGKIHFRGFFDTWSIPPDSVAQHDGKARIEALLADDYAETIITREQYEAALSTKNDGWIEWGGGKCPLHHGAIVDVKLRNGSTKYAQEALSLEGYASYPFWRKDDTPGDIIAYRLHKPQQEEHPEAREEDINDCIGQAPAPIWNGEGLPPVGCECEARFRHRNSAEWMYFRCVAVDCDVAFGWAGKDAVALEWESYQFRRIRSEADMKRESVISKITDAICGEVPDTGMATAAKYAARVYDAIVAGEVDGIRID